METPMTISDYDYSSDATSTVSEGGLNGGARRTMLRKTKII